MSGALFSGCFTYKKLHESTPINLSAPTANNRVKKKTQQNGGGRPAKPNWGNSVFQLL